ncbi:Uncharacterised protein [Klebsiella pneumoniae]|nr:Uncharacterised protein [Klebsiella pneumoniae]
MTITLQAVNELIASLESAGELSIREQKFLKLAKEFRICSASLDAAIKTGNMLADQNSQLAAENVALKAEQVRIFNSGYLRGHESTVEGYYVDIHQDDITTYHEDVVAEISEEQTPATDRIMTESEALKFQVEQLAAENVAMKAAFNKPDAWLSFHSIPPTYQEPDRGGEYLAVHEQPGEKNDDGSDSWPVYAKPEIETPATDRIVAGIKADGAEACVRALVTSDDDDFTDAPNICAMVAYQLRDGGNGE